MTLGSATSGYGQAGMTLSGSVVQLAHSRAVARAQFAAAERILAAGLALEQGAPQLVRQAAAGMSQGADALASMATGLGQSLDVYA